MKKWHPVFFPIAVYLEVFVHMTLATYYTGWESGFQIAMIAMCVLIACADYMDRALKVRSINSTALCILVMAVYMSLCIITHDRTPNYPLPAEVCHNTQLFMGFIVFAIIICFLFIFVQMTTKSEEYLAEQAGHDALTGMPNRYFIMEYLWAMKKDSGLDGYWLSIMDIDDFKSTNDTYGHNCGDYILVQIADILLSKSEECTVCRWGGEEFILIGKKDDGAAGYARAIEDVRNRIMKKSFVYKDYVIHITITAGYEEYEHGLTVEEWVDRADKKLYYGKSHGKNQVVT